MDNQIYVCEKCIEIFDKEIELINHKCETNEKEIIIDKSNKIDEEIKKEPELNEKKIIIKINKNKKNNKKKEIYKCKKCEFETKYKNNLYRHNKHFCKNTSQSN